MLRSKKYILTVLVLAAVELITPASASALALRKCMDWLVSGSAKEARMRPHEGDYQRFIYERNHNPQLNPPTAYFTPETLDSDLLLAVEFWWYPENIWHEVVSDEYGSQLSAIEEKQMELGFKVPAAEELISMDLALKIYQAELAEREREEKEKPPMEIGNPGPILPPPLPQKQEKESPSESEGWKRKYGRDSGRSASPLQPQAPTPSFDSSTPTSFGTDNSGI